MAELATSLTASTDDRLAQAEAVVRAHCGWHIAPVRSETATLESGSDLLLLPTLKLVSVTRVLDEEGQEVDPTTYEVDTRGWVRRTGYRLWCVQPWGRITIDYTHGYDEPPADVTGVVQAVAQRALANPGSLLRDQVGPFSNSYSMTGLNETVPLALLEAERRILGPYTLPARL